ncbi:MAG: ATP-binding cassette domain-containing protein [Bacteroidales bacterium]|nr:ATP-binding cassette domain-containing protein [Bacteroidales bacterium]
MGLITCTNVVKRFGNFTALDNINLDIPEGKIFGFLGPNGAGKTTLIRIINRITLPTEGQVLFNGKELRLSDIEKIGYLPEERGLYKKMKVGEQAVYLAMLKGLSKGEATRELMKWFQKFGIQPWWNRKVEELSKGMAQKIQFITTVLHNPKLLILDEPFSGFDPINVNLIKDEILRMKDEGCSIILSTHNMESVEELCDEIALINKAKLVISGSVDKIRSEYGHNRVEILFSGAVGEAVAEAESQAPKDVEGLFTVLSTEKVKDEFRSVLELAPGVTHNDVMSALIKQVNLDSYQKLMPKMSEIFIKLVGESGGATSQSIDDYRKAHGGK